MQQRSVKTSLQDRYLQLPRVVLVLVHLAIGPTKAVADFLVMHFHTMHFQTVAVTLFTALVHFSLRLTKLNFQEQSHRVHLKSQASEAWRCAGNQMVTDETS